VAMQRRVAAIGLQSFDCGAGALRGHTFHFSQLETPLLPLTKAARHPAGVPGEAVYRKAGVTASYVHAYFSSNPAAAAELFGG